MTAFQNGNHWLSLHDQDFWQELVTVLAREIDLYLNIISTGASIHERDGQKMASCLISSDAAQVYPSYPLGPKRREEGEIAFYETSNLISTYIHFCPSSSTL